MHSYAVYRCQGHSISLACNLEYFTKLGHKLPTVLNNIVTCESFLSAHFPKPDGAVKGSTMDRNQTHTVAVLGQMNVGVIRFPAEAIKWMPCGLAMLCVS